MDRHQPKPWQAPLEYPSDGKKRTTIDFQDLARLDEGELLNDSIVSFYLRYLQEHSQPDIARRIYIFNTFFYQKLTRTKGDINYEAVQRWTDADLFNYAYVVVPINEGAHWYVVIICNLPVLAELCEKRQDANPASISTQTRKATETKTESAKQTRIPTLQKIDLSHNDADIGPSKTGKRKTIVSDSEADPAEGEGKEQSPRENDVRLVSSKRSLGYLFLTVDSRPIIFALDSLGHSRGHTMQNLKRYLVMEGKTKRSLRIKISDIRRKTVKGIPQQDNIFDCGVCLLVYMKKFFQDPAAFVDGLVQGELDEKHWRDFDASKMRVEIREIILDLERHRTRAVESETLTAPTKSNESPTTSAVGTTPHKNQKVRFPLGNDSTPIHTPIVLGGPTSPFSISDSPLAKKSLRRRRKKPTLPIVKDGGPSHESVRPILECVGSEPGTAGKGMAYPDLLLCTELIYISK